MDSKELDDAFNSLRTALDGIFEKLERHFEDNKVKIAFSHTTISFQFNPDTKIDIYKSALIYVDDGFNSLLQDKGSGIQSAVIIGLFDFYTRNIAHSSSSLLTVEEPELYLHPQARRVISSRLDDFLDGNKNQVVITSHASEFITTAHEDLNVILVSRDKNKHSKAINTTFNDPKERQILTKSQNSEMFFADKVILVEGGDKYIIEAASRYFGEKIEKDLGPNWLDEKNISVISVGGKDEFWKYHKKRDINTNINPIDQMRLCGGMVQTTYWQ